MGPMFPIYNPNNLEGVSRGQEIKRHSSLKPPTQDFRNVLEEVLSQERIKFSRHALKRASQRGIHFDRVDLNKISDAVDKMQRKGSKEALLLYKEVGLLVNVKDRTVITCIDKGRLKEDVFTNIDGVMIVE